MSHTHGRAEIEQREIDKLPVRDRVDSGVWFSSDKESLQVHPVH